MTSLPANSLAPSHPPQEVSADAAASVIIATIAPVSGATGVQTHSRDMQAGLSRAGHPCLLQTPLTSNMLWAPVFGVRPLLLKHLNKSWSTWWHRRWHEVALRVGLTRAMRDHKIAAVIAQCPVSARAAMDARKRAGGQFPVVMVCHFNYSEATEYRDKGELAGRFFDAMLAMEEQVLESVDQVIYVSHWAQRVVEQERNIRPRASCVIWNGISPQTSPSTLKRSDLGFDAQDLLLINVGTLEPRKNQLALVEFLSKVSPDFSNIRLVLIGDGPSRGQIEARIAQLRLQPKVRLLGYRRDVAQVLSLGDIYVHGSLLENCPMVLLEAARAALPIAAVPAGGVPELLNALGGTSLDLENPAPLLSLLNSAQLRAEAGQFARQAFERHFTCEAMVGQYLRILQASATTGGIGCP